ncbi:threonine ammonia-lyase [Ktedonosporobacter rubrisoli]|uniref:threonine ammonia-lyase n=1 Tax=Ktedonosporobacter rubrisoli TaxID=2509675 RepID=A0A4P6JTW0_KTERU|nr:threonine ammonia-lyase [Ktedonosporobacter rubrisoli]QBD78722.1 threonine ammonia-lyase [Ktedonosporobacter rubrisoli]
MTRFEPVPGAPTIRDIERAREVISSSVSVTPLLHSQTFSTMTGANVYLKPENLQKAGSFKVRGATYKISRLSEEERTRGVVATSMGNHAQAVAIAARALGVPATIVMPERAPLVKVMATQGYGARVILHGETFEDAYQFACRLQEETGATFIHSFDDHDLIAGQGTLGLEILEQVPQVDAIIVPVGGGGLIAGVTVAVKSLRPDVQIIGVQAAGADAVKRSLEADKIITLPQLNTIADGIRINSPGKLPFAILRSYLDQIVTVDDKEIVSALLLLLERCKLQVEGAGSVGLAALLHPGLLNLVGKNVVLLLSGGNIDINLLGGFIEYGLVAQGRITTLRTLLDDRPGELKRLLTLIADLDINVREMTYYRTLQPAPLPQNEVTLMVETRNHDHLEQLLQVLREQKCEVLQVHVSLSSARQTNTPSGR